MAANTLNILRPSVNNLAARIFVRAAGLDFEEVDVWGKTMEAEYLDKYAPHLTPTLEDPLGLLIELASYRFDPPFGYTHSDVLFEAHRLRSERGDYNIDREHLADAIEELIRRSRPSLSDDRAAADPYHKQTA